MPIVRGEAAIDQELDLVYPPPFKKDSRDFSEKAFKVSLLFATTDGKGRSRPAEVAVVELDVAQFAVKGEAPAQRNNIPITLPARSAKSGRGSLATPSEGASLTASITATLTSIEVGCDDDESISSAMQRPSIMSQARGSVNLAAGGLATALSKDRDPYEQNLDGFNSDEEGSVAGLSETSSFGLSAANPSSFALGAVRDPYADPLTQAVQSAALDVSDAGAPSSSVAAAAAPSASRRGSVQPQAAASTALAQANSQLADLRQQLEEAKQAAGAAQALSPGRQGRACRRRSSRRAPARALPHSRRWPH